MRLFLALSIEVAFLLIRHAVVLNNRVLHEHRTLVSYHIQRFTVLTLIRRDRLASAA